MKILLAAVFLTLSSFVCHGQCPSNKGQLDISLSYGSISTDQISLGVQEDTKTLTYISGAAYISVRYFLYSCLALGFTGGVTNERGQYTDAYNLSSIVSTYKQSVTVIAPEVYYVYFFRKYFELYTFIGAGPAFTTVTTTTNPTPYDPGSVVTTGQDKIKMQYTPVGARIGGRIGGFVELGFGYKGLVNAGLSFKLGRPSWWRE